VIISYRVCAAETPRPCWYESLDTTNANHYFVQKLGRKWQWSSQCKGVLGPFSSLKWGWTRVLPLWKLFG
jgi:hypothetical protein